MNEYKIDVLQVDQRKLEVEAQLGKELIVPAQLRDPHPLIARVKTQFEKPGASTYGNGLLASGFNEVDIHVSPANANRALRFMNTFIKLLPVRGYTLTIEEKSCSVMFDDEKIQVKFRERTTRSEQQAKGFSYNRFEPTGILYFKIEYMSWSKEFTNEKLPLEDQLAYILAYIDLKANLIRKEQAAWKIRREAEEAKRKIIRDLAAVKAKELSDLKLLISRAQRFMTANQLREYISSVEHHAVANNSLNDEITLWIEWAKKKADWVDPIINGDDELLHHIDRDKILDKEPERPEPFRYG